MALHMYGYRQGRLKTRYQLKCGIGRQNAGHVLDRDRVGAHVFDLLGQVDPHFQGMHRAGGVGDGALGMLAQLLDGLERGLQVARIVHRVKHAEHIDAIERGPLNEFFHHVIGVMAITQQILPAQQHLLASVGHGFFQLADAVPRVFTQVTDARIEGRAAPRLHGPETDLIQLGRDRQHVFQAHTGGQDRLVGVTQHYISNSECFLYGCHTDAPCQT